MANKNVAKSSGLPYPVQMGIVMGILGGIISGASFVVINYWPQPASVAPYFGFQEGFVWGAVVGFSFGALLAYMNDDRHFDIPQA